MASPARQKNESYDDYKKRRKREAVQTKRALKPRPVPESWYDGQVPTYIQVADEAGFVHFIKKRKYYPDGSSTARPFRRTALHPKEVRKADKAKKLVQC